MLSCRNTNYCLDIEMFCSGLCLSYPGCFLIHVQYFQQQISVQRRNILSDLLLTCEYALDVAGLGKKEADEF